MQVLWEGELTDEFLPTRGIRQGDLISPYIFILYIEQLSHGICDVVNTGFWTPVHLSRHGIPLYHLFADDLLLLAEASCAQASVINSILETYCSNLGARVSKAKTRVYFSRNV